MEAPGRLLAYSDCFYFYVENGVDDGLRKNSVLRRIKKEADVLAKLNGFIDEFESREFCTSLKYSIANQNIKRIRHSSFENLIEIRIANSLWRVLSYLDTRRSTIVMIDAMKAHVKGRHISKLAESNRSQIKDIESILKRKEVI